MKKSELKQLIKEELIKVLKENEDVPRLSKNKLADWMEKNENLVGNFIDGSQDYYKILNFIRTGNPSQFYLNRIFDGINKKYGLNLNKPNFYEDKIDYKTGPDIKIDPSTVSGPYDPTNPFRSPSA